MLKKYSIITLLLFAYTIVLAHSIIPHHHHHNNKNEAKQSEHHHHSNHDSDHHDNDDDDKSLAHEFGNYVHSGNTSDVYQQPDTQLDHATMATIYLVVAFNFNIRLIQSPPPVVRLSNHCIPLVQCYLSSKGLRAPPCDLV